MKVNFAACTVVFDRYEWCSKKNYKSSRIQTQKPNVNVLLKKKWQVIKQGEDFWCNTRSKILLVKLLSKYLKEDENTIVNIKDDADKHIGGPSLVFECKKKDVTVFAEGTILFCTYWKKRLGKSSWKPAVRSMKLKSWWIFLRL